MSYARKRNRLIIPIVLEGEFSLNVKTGKQNISYWEAIPVELTELRSQFLFYEKTNFIAKFEQALALFVREPQRWGDMSSPPPADPRSGSETAHDGIRLYNNACDYAERMEFSTAEKMFQKLVNQADPDFGAESREWIGILRQYERIIAMDENASTRFRVRRMWDDYKKLFPKEFIDGIFDPKGFDGNL